MVLVEVGSVVVLTTSKTATTRMLPVLSDTTVTGRDVAAVLSRVRESGWHCDKSTELSEDRQLQALGDGSG